MQPITATTPLINTFTPPTARQPLPAGSATALPQANPAHQAQFGNVFSMPVINGIVRLVGKMQQNQNIELLVSDVGGMVLPRTYLEWKERGADMGIETGIRESSGTISIVFLSGWMSLLGMKLATYLAKRNQQSKLNRGLPVINWTKSHIAAPTLTMLGNHFKHSLNQSNGSSLLELKKHFYNSVFKQLQSSSPELAAALINGIERGTVNAHQQINAGQIAKGELTPQQRKHLVELMVSNTSRKPRLEAASKFATGANSYLTDNVHIWLDKSASKKRHRMIANKSLPQLLNDMDTFWEQFVKGLGLTEFEHELVAKGQKATEQTTLNQTFINKLSNRLFGQTSMGQQHTSIWRKLFPTIKHGVLPYVLRKRNLLVALPYFVTIGLSVGVAFFNNWLTKRRHHGAVHFPGLGSPESQLNSGQQVPNTSNTNLTPQTQFRGSTV